MKQKIKQELDGKKILILGFVREGKSSYSFIKQNVEYTKLAIADKNAIGELISKTITENLLGGTEVFIAEIGSFKVYLPASFNRIHPYLVVEGRARYTVDINTFGIGAVIKIENYLASLTDKVKELNQNLITLEMQLKQAESTIDESYKFTEQLSALYEKLKEIDKELGIK